VPEKVKKKLSPADLVGTIGLVVSTGIIMRMAFLPATSDNNAFQ
jgi:hypothetical protein